MEADDENGVTDAVMDLGTQGLLPGTYTVSITKKSDGSSVVLGTFDVNTSDSETNDDETEVEFGGAAGLQLPADLSPLDIATISISDADTNAVLVGDFTSVSTTVQSVFNANVAVTPGAAAPNANGHAVLHSAVKKGVAKNKFLLVVQGAPANTVLTVDVNGSPVTVVKSDRRGKVMMNKLPNGVSASTLASMQFLDAGSNLAFGINF